MYAIDATAELPQATDQPRERSTELTTAQCHALLRERGWGVVSIVDATDRPYAVPVAYAFDGDGLFLATGQGRKLRALEQNPTVSFNVLDVERFDQWRSVVVLGTARPLWAGEERIAALRAFIAQRRPVGFELTSNDALKLMRARIYRIDIAELTGRSQNAAGEWPVAADRGTVGAQDEANAASADGASAEEVFAGALREADAKLAMQSLRRLVRAIRTTNATLERDRGLSGAQLFVLREIAATPGLSISALARRTLTSQSAVSEVVSRLVASGFVVRDVSEDDRRRTELRPTEAGERLLDGAPETVQEQLLSSFRTLAREDRRVIAGALDRWLSAAGLNGTPATMFFEPTST